MSPGSVGQGLADTFDVATYLVGVFGFLALAGGAVNLRLRARWQILKTRGLRR